MSASTEGNPQWLLRLEAAQVQLKPESYVYWLQNKAAAYGVPQDVIDAQLARVTSAPVTQTVEDAAKEVIPEEVTQEEEQPVKRKRKKVSEE